MVNNQVESFLTPECDDRFLAAVTPENSADKPFSLIFPGAFNPLHEGHRRIATIASERTGLPLWFELSLANVDKPTLSPDQVRNRLKHDFSPHGLLLTRSARFSDKAELFPGCIFVVGADTLIRINDPRYYASVSARNSKLERLAGLSCSFLAFARKSGNIVLDEANVELDRRLERLCQHIPADVFMMDISSSEIRNGDATGP